VRVRDKTSAKSYPISWWRNGDRKKKKKKFEMLSYICKETRNWQLRIAHFTMVKTRNGTERTLDGRAEIRSSWKVQNSIGLVKYCVLAVRQDRIP
jgi:hypothetical protein